MGGIGGGGGRQISSNKKALLKKIETLNFFFPIGKLWNGKYKPKCISDDKIESIPSGFF